MIRSDTRFETVISRLPNPRDYQMARKHQRRRQPFAHGETKRTHLVYGTVGFFSLIVVFAIASLWKQSSDYNAQTNLFSNISDIPASSSFDVIFILGGGAPTAWNILPVYVQQRCDDALKVSNKRTPLLCLSAGTAHVPQLLSPQGLPVWESTACAAYILEKDPERNVFVETTSYDTIGNAFYARTSHAELAGWKKILIVTNEVSAFMIESAAAWRRVWVLSPSLTPTFLCSPSSTWHARRQFSIGCFTCLPDPIRTTSTIGSRPMWVSAMLLSKRATKKKHRVCSLWSDWPKSIPHCQSCGSS